MKEIFKNIDGYKGKYKISNLGNVKSLKKDILVYKNSVQKYKYLRKEKILKQVKTKTGYLQVNLSNGIKFTCYHTHRLVAKAFIKNTFNKPQVNHIDGNKTNNIVSNLEWVTASENSKHSYKIGLSNAWHKKNSGKNTPTAKAILQLDLNGNLIKEWECGLDAVRKIGCNSSGISRCCHGIIKKHYGYKWQFK